MTGFDRLVGALARALHMLAAAWLFVLALLILADVLGRGVFNQPVPGTAEIVANSLVAIAFLQLSHAIRMHGMLRAELLQPYVPGWLWRSFIVGGYVVGALFFLAIAYASWEPMLNAWEIKEWQGEGALRVPTYPLRSLIVAMCVMAAICYAFLAIKATRGEETAGATSVP